MTTKGRPAARSAGSWPPPPDTLSLSSHEVHVWRVSLDQPATCVRRLAQTLSDDERARAGRFRFERDHRRFVVGRGVLRAILGRYLGAEPGRLQFRYGARGKPYLAGEFDGSPLRFSLAHSHRLALCALTRDREVGVDLEYVRPMPDAPQMVARFFSPHENAVWSELPASQKEQAFYACWTRKEAYIKALGDGLARPLDRFDVSLAPGEPAQLLNVDGEPGEVPRWALETLAPARGYVGALAAEGHGWRLSCWRWEPAC
jgi:4'-phosphopantetheinyl transferase